MAPKTAVIIDDEPDVTTYFETLLTDNGWSVRTANDPNALIALRKDDRTATVPVVLVTGIQETLKADFGNFLDRFKKYHPDAYLQKPIDAEKLFQTLEEVTSRSGHEAASPA